MATPQSTITTITANALSFKIGLIVWSLGYELTAVGL
jgi:hypothetical protein